MVQLINLRGYGLRKTNPGICKDVLLIARPAYKLKSSNYLGLYFHATCNENPFHTPAPTVPNRAHLLPIQYMYVIVLICWNWREIFRVENCTSKYKLWQVQNPHLGVYSSSSWVAREGLFIPRQQVEGGTYPVLQCKDESPHSCTVSIFECGHSHRQPSWWPTISKLLGVRRNLLLHSPNWPLLWRAQRQKPFRKRI